MSSRDDERFMRRAIAAAARPVHPSPNPRVGAVVVRDRRVLQIGEHLGPGRPHAESEALSGIDASGATLYVTLEPCNHHGSTPPCVPAIVAAGVQRVVVALEDPDPRVAGSGISALRGNGIEVTVGVLADAARRQNRDYIHQRLTGRPFVALKLAMTLDGRMAAPDRSSRWITSDATRRWVHELRSRVDAVMVGSGTVLADDPRLTPRPATAAPLPLRVVLDGRGRVPADAAIFSDPEDARTLVVTSGAPFETQTSWKEAGAEVALVTSSRSGVDLDEVLDELGRRSIVSVLCEGGAALATSLLREHLVDRLHIHVGPLLVGAGGVSLGDLGVTSMSDAGRWTTVDVRRSGADAMLTLEPR